MNGEMLKKAGYKVGDTLWKPGAKDDLNGRELTGRIASFTEQGTPIPEYVNNAINSSHKSTGNAGYAGEVGLGADQAAYNRQYEQDNDVEYGQTNQQLKANGYDDEGIDNYWEKTNTQRQAIADARNGNQGQQSQTQQTQAGFQQSQGFNQASSQGQNDQNASGLRSYASFNYQPNASQYGTKQFDFKSGNKGKMMNINFDFDPNRFNQGQ